MTVMRARPVACAGHLPDRIVPNAEFEATLDTSDAWIRSRSGIRERRFAAEGELTSDLAIAAAKKALAQAGMTAGELDAIILATATPDQTFPSTATRVQHGLGMTGGFAFDVQAVCAGFLYALSTANAMIVSGQAKTVMVIGAETFSRIMDWTDRATCVLFGDGAGAMILRAEPGTGGPQDSGILSVKLHSDGAHNQILYVDGGPSETGSVGVLRMDGKKVFVHAVNKLAAVSEEAMAAAGVSADQLDWMAPHQANIRIIEGMAKKMRLPMDKVIVTVERHGNTSAASIPLALGEAMEDGRIRPGHLVLMEAIGGGLAWGGAVARF